MKTNEIQIGDWLYSIINKFDHTEKKLCKVTGIRTDSDVPLIQCDDTDVWYPLDSYEPIPITAEMLSKCGFKKNKTGQWAIEKKHSIGCCGQTCSNTNPLEYAVWWDRFGLGCVSYLEKEGNMTLHIGYELLT